MCVLPLLFTYSREFPRPSDVYYPPTTYAAAETELVLLGLRNPTSPSATHSRHASIIGYREPPLHRPNRRIGHALISNRVRSRQGAPNHMPGRVGRRVGVG